MPSPAREPVPRPDVKVAGVQDRDDAVRSAPSNRDKATRPMTSSARSGASRPNRIPKYHRSVLAARLPLLASLLVVVACSAAPAGSPQGSLSQASQQPSRLPDSGPSASTGPMDLPASIVDPVVGEIARLAGVPVDQVIVISAESMIFPDGGLGCPVPGMNYIQVQVEGFKLVAEAGGAKYDFRGTGPDSFRRCTKKS